MEAIILAGGLGTRLRIVVPNVPKPMAPVNGRPFLEYQLEYWIEQGVESFILAVGYQHQIIENHFGDRFQGVSIVYSVEDQPLGTGGGLFLALQRIHDDHPFLILNGDTFFEVNLQEQLTFHLSKCAELTFALKELSVNDRYDCARFGVDGKIMSLNAKVLKSGCAIINGGVYLAQKSVFDGVLYSPNTCISLEKEIFPKLLSEKKQLFGHICDGRFIDIGVPEDYRKAGDVLRHS